MLVHRCLINYAAVAWALTLCAASWNLASQRFRAEDFVLRKRYAEYRAPLHLVVDRQEQRVTLYSEPGRLGYTRVDGPSPFGALIRLPEPFELDLDTSDLA